MTMKACIMGGGKGTRLRPLTFERPKPCIPVLGKPLVAHTVQHLVNQGFTQQVLTLGYKGENVEDALGDGSQLGGSFRYVYEKQKLGTAGGVKNAEHLLDGSPFLVVGGDHMLDFNVRDLYNYHEEHDAPVTVALMCVDDPREFGIAEINAAGDIKRFKEKPGPGEVFSNLASTGIYVVDPEVLDMIPDGEKYDFAKDLFPRLLEQHSMKGWLVQGEWSDVGRPSSYRSAVKWLLKDISSQISGAVNMYSSNIKGPVEIHGGVEIGKGSSVIGPVWIGRDVTIGEDVLIGPYTAIGEGSSIGDGSMVLSSYLFNDVAIGPDNAVSSSIVDSGTITGRDVDLENGTVIGPRVTLGDGVTVHSEVRIWPDVEVLSDERITETHKNEEYGVTTSGS